MIQLPPNDGPQTSNKRDKEDGSTAFRFMVGQDQMNLKVKLLAYVGLVMLIAFSCHKHTFDSSKSKRNTLRRIMTISLIFPFLFFYFSVLFLLLGSLFFLSLSFHITPPLSFSQIPNTPKGTFQFMVISNSIRRSAKSHLLSLYNGLGLLFHNSSCICWLCI